MVKRLMSVVLMVGSVALGSLMHAAGANYDRACVKCKAWFKADHKDPRDQFMCAAAQGHNEKIRQLLATDPELAQYKRHNDDVTPLIAAAWQAGDVCTVELLVAANAVIDAKSKSKGWTALMFAVQRESVAVVKALLKAKASPDVREVKEHTALMLAAGRGCEEIMVSLLEARAQVGLQCEKGGTPVMYAAGLNHPGAVDILLQQAPVEAQIHAKTQYGNTVLLETLTLLPHETAILKRLLAVGGALIDEPNNFGITPAMWAAYCNYKEALELLLAAGASVVLRSREQKTARMYALDKGHAEVAEILAVAEERECNAEEKSAEILSAEV